MKKMFQCLDDRFGSDSYPCGEASAEDYAARYLLPLAREWAADGDPIDGIETDTPDEDAIRILARLVSEVVSERTETVSE